MRCLKNYTLILLEPIVYVWGWGSVEGQKGARVEVREHEGDEIGETDWSWVLQGLPCTLHLEVLVLLLVVAS